MDANSFLSKCLILKENEQNNFSNFHNTLFLQRKRTRDVL
jgi:hypothetical protein